MNAQEILRISTNHDDIEQAMKIVATFGANEEELNKIKKYISNEFRELGNNRILYFLEKDLEPIGMVQLILKNADEDPNLANGKDVAHVHTLQISKQHHRKGYGYKLMQLLEQEAQKQGILKLTLGVDSDNEKAIRLYEKLNYSLLKIAEGRTPQVKLYYLQKDIKI